jgi:endonuclease YncB( thermonuclease family)
MKSYMKLLALAVLLMAPMPVQAQATPSPTLPAIGGDTLVGKADIVDGDTIDISGRRIDLFGIDAPEKDQLCEAAGQKWSCGQNATFGLSAIVERQWVHCRIVTTDTDGRIAAICRLAGANGPDINAAMVRQGWAVADRRPPAPYLAEENAARAAKAGIWVGERRAR